jgi:hypothetical protein
MNQINGFSLNRMIIASGIKIEIRNIWKMNVSITISYDPASLVIFLINDQERLFVKNLYECLWI